MRTLSVVTVEDGALVVASDTGERFRIAVDDALLSALRREPAADVRRLSPREIQAQVRAGLTPQQVAAVSGAPLAFVERFVGPVLAERRFVVDTALATRLPAGEDGEKRVFGAMMAARLAALDADGVRWSSAKEATGWVVAVAFTADGVEHDARWRFDPKRQQLAPDNVEAATLSQDGVPAALTPRLRAIEPTGPVRTAPQTAPSRFDSQAFALPPVVVQEDSAPDTSPDLPPTEAIPVARAAHRSTAATPAAPPAATPVVAPAPTPTVAPAAQRAPSAPTAPPSPVTPIRPAQAAAPVTRLPDRSPEPDEDDDAPRSPVRPVTGRRGRPRDGRRPTRADDPAPTRPVSLPGRGRGGRTSMPSWDEIVFGRDDD